MHVGSPTIHASHFSPFFSIHDSIFFVPFIAGPSSSPVIKREIDPKFLYFGIKRATAAIKQAMLPFISTIPRPYIFPSAIVAENGGYVQ
ncbi:hypothetical protein FXW26_02015 [Candidatus Liberibacter asiaticus]|nr:hypothetical protein FXW26_02015 [Candidatus Liberibacter asiaticus]